MKQICLLVVILFSASFIANAQQTNSLLKLKDPAKSQQLLDSFRVKKNLQLLSQQYNPQLLNQQMIWRKNTGGRMPCIQPDMSQFTTMPNAANKEILKGLSFMPNGYDNKILLQKLPSTSGKSGNTIIKPSK